MAQVNCCNAAGYSCPALVPNCDIVAPYEDAWKIQNGLEEWIDELKTNWKIDIIYNEHRLK